MSNPTPAAMAATEELMDLLRTRTVARLQSEASSGDLDKEIIAIIDRHMQESQGSCLTVRADQISEIHLGNNPWIKVELPTDEDYRAAVEAMSPLPERPKE